MRLGAAALLAGLCTAACGTGNPATADAQAADQIADMADVSDNLAQDAVTDAAATEIADAILEGSEAVVDAADFQDTIEKDAPDSVVVDISLPADAIDAGLDSLADVAAALDASATADVPDIANFAEISADADAVGAPDVAIWPDVATDVKYDNDAYPLGFVSLITGKNAVIELGKMNVAATIGAGGEPFHGCGVLPGQKTVYLPGNAALDRYDQGSSAKNWQFIKSIKSPVHPGQVRGALNGSVIGIVDGFMVLDQSGIDFKSGNLPPGSKNLAIFYPQTETFAKIVVVTSPSTIAVSADGATIYAANWIEHTVSVVETKTAQVVDTWEIPANPAVPKWIGPSDVKVSHNGLWVATANLTGSSVTIFDVNATLAPPQVAVFEKKLVHWVDFSADDSRVVVVLWQDVPMLGMEMKNKDIVNEIQILDRPTLQKIGTIKLAGQLIAHATVPPGSKFLYAMGSNSLVSQFNLDTLALTGQTPGLLGPEPAMVMQF